MIFCKSRRREKREIGRYAEIKTVASPSSRRFQKRQPRGACWQRLHSIPLVELAAHTRIVLRVVGLEGDPYISKSGKPPEDVHDKRRGTSARFSPVDFL